jgi:DNA polymerase-4
MTILARRYGVVGKQLWLACQGRDLDGVVTEVAPPKTVGHGKVLPPRTRSARVIETYLRHMCEKVAARLRRYALQPGRLYVGVRLAGPTDDQRGADYEVPYGLPDGKRFFELARQFLKSHWQGEAVTHVQVTATHLRYESGQLDLFGTDPTEALAQRAARRAAALDRINARFGEFTVAAAPLLERSTMPNVIAPAWRPDGIRQNIPK